MGEWSKSIGEFGESIVEQFLEMIGWGSAQKGVPIPCCYPEKHKRDSAKGDRQTHGIDFLYSYQSPLVDGVLDNVLISSKFSTKPYPQNPSNKFKEHLIDIAQTVECFKFSESRTTINQQYTVDRANDIGVIFWLNNSEDGNPDLISKVASIRNPEDIIFESVFMVDNMRIAFIFDTIKFVQGQFNQHEIKFYYPRSGKNVDPISRIDSGFVLPVQYINSSIIPLRVEKGEEKTLVISTIDSFSEGYLKRLIGLAQDLSHTWVSNVLLLFPDYNELEHSKDVQRAKTMFNDIKFVRSIEIASFNLSFRSLS